MNKSFTEMVRAYSAWKLQEKGNGKLTRTELSNLREAFKVTQKPIRENKKAHPLNEALKQKVAAYRKWKLAEKGSDKINEDELKMLKQTVLKEAKEAKPQGQSFDVYLANYKQFKESKEGKGSKITYKELKALKENFKEAQSKGIKLREADMGGAAPIPGDPNAMGGADAGLDPAAGGADPNAAAPQDPMAMQGAIDQAVAALQPFTAGGADPLGAGAGAPPVAGMPPGDPAAAQAPNLMEQAVSQYRAWKLKEKGTDKLTEGEVKSIREAIAKQSAPKSKYQQIKERIAQRQAALESMQENSMGPLTVAQLANSNLSKHTKGNSQNTADSNNESPYATVPAATTLAKGHSSGAASGETKAAKTWPTKAMGKEAGGALQGASATQTRVKENEEPTEEKPDTLNEGVKTVTDVYVDRYFEPKLNFDRIKESMKSGLLG